MKPTDQKPTYELRNWHLGTAGLMYGNVFGNPKFADGFYIHTSEVQAFSRTEKWVETVNTVYTLSDDPYGEKHLLRGRLAGGKDYEPEDSGPLSDSIL